MKSFLNIIGLHTQSHRASIFLESKFVGGGTHFEYSVKSILYVTYACNWTCCWFGLALPVEETVVIGLAHFIICISDVDSCTFLA
jgi:hypothetical protein